jgi:hypothetical protein
VKGSNTLHHAIGTRSIKSIQVASFSEGRTILSDPSSHTPRVWEHIPVAPSWDRVQAAAIGRAPRTAVLRDVNSDLAHRINSWEKTSGAPVHGPLNGWTAIAAQAHRQPRSLPRMLPVIR